MLDELGVSAKLVEVRLWLCVQIIKIKSALDSESRDNGIDCHKDLKAVSERRHYHGLCPNHTSVAYLEANDQASVAAAQNANDWESQSQIRPFKHVCIRWAASSVNLSWQNLEAARAHATCLIEANLHQNGNDHVMGWNVEGQSYNANSNCCLPEESTVFEQANDVITRILRGLIKRHFQLISITHDTILKVVVEQCDFDAIFYRRLVLKLVSIRQQNVCLKLLHWSWWGLFVYFFTTNFWADNWVERGNKLVPVLGSNLQTVKRGILERETKLGIISLWKDTKRKSSLHKSLERICATYLREWLQGDRTCVVEWLSIPFLEYVANVFSDEELFADIPRVEKENDDSHDQQKIDQESQEVCVWQQVDI